MHCVNNAFTEDGGPMNGFKGRGYSDLIQISTVYTATVSCPSWQTCTYRGRRRVDDAGCQGLLENISPLPPSRAKTSLQEGNRALGRRSVVQ